MFRFVPPFTAMQEQMDLADILDHAFRRLTGPVYTTQACDVLVGNQWIGPSPRSSTSTVRLRALSMGIYGSRKIWTNTTPTANSWRMSPLQ